MPQHYNLSTVTAEFEVVPLFDYLRDAMFAPRTAHLATSAARIGIHHYLRAPARPSVDSEVAEPDTQLYAQTLDTDPFSVTLEPDPYQQRINGLLDRNDGTITADTRFSVWATVTLGDLTLPAEEAAGRLAGLARALPFSQKREVTFTSHKIEGEPSGQLTATIALAHHPASVRRLPQPIVGRWRSDAGYRSICNDCGAALQ